MIAALARKSAVKQAPGQKGFAAFNGALCYEAGKGAKEFAETHGLATEDAKDVEKVTHLVTQASMVPEFVLEVAEATKDRCGGKTHSVHGTRGGRSMALAWILAA